MIRPSIRWFARVLLPVLLLALAACAGPAKLAERSEKELRSGRVDEAYRYAKRAVDKDPRNLRARAALDGAAEVIADDWRRRIVEGSIDTLGAARQILEFEDFRAELARYGATLTPDPDYEAREHGLRTGAAAISYRLAEEHLDAGRPKAAYFEFVRAQQLDPGLRDVGERVARTHELAIARVAVLPVVNQTDLPGLTQEIDAESHAALGQHLAPHEFLRLLDRKQVLDRMSAAQLEELPRDQAAAIGRRAGADLVIRGRIHSVRSTTDTDRYHETIFRKVTERDSSGRRFDRWRDLTFQGVARRRAVTVSYDLEVVDVESGEVLSTRADAVQIVARTVFSDFEAPGDCDDYCLIPPDQKRSDARRAGRVEGEWKRVFGSWTLPQLLEVAQDHGEHRYYRRQHAPDFRASRPVFLGELPPEEDLARVALDDLWKPMLAMLEEVDAR